MKFANVLYSIYLKLQWQVWWFL